MIICLKGHHMPSVKKLYASLFLLIVISDPPLWNDNSTDVTYAELNGTALITCDVCANPPPALDGYQWIRNGAELTQVCAVSQDNLKKYYHF